MNIFRNIGEDNEDNIVVLGIIVTIIAIIIGIVYIADKSSKSEGARLERIFSASTAESRKDYVRCILIKGRGNVQFGGNELCEALLIKEPSCR